MLHKSFDTSWIIIFFVLTILIFFRERALMGHCQILVNKDETTMNIFTKERRYSGLV